MAGCLWNCCCATRSTLPRIYAITIEPILVLRAGRDQVVQPERTDALLHGLRDKAVRVQEFALANHSTIFRANGF